MAILRGASAPPSSKTRPKLSRRIVTEGLTQAATNYWVKKLYSVYTEVGLQKRTHGAIRADVLAFNMKQQFIINEVKSCWSDYTTDNKWASYLPFCNKMYFILHRGLCDTEKGQIICEDAKHLGVGVMRLGTSGTLSVVQNAKTRELDEDRKYWLLTKLAWRGGNSRYNMKRLKRVYL